MSHRSVFCIAASRDRADRLVQDLERHKFPGAEISILFLDRRVTAPPPAPGASEVAATRPARAMRDALRWIRDTGRVVMHGAGPLVDADPRSVVLRGTTTGGVAASDRVRKRFAARAAEIFTIVEVTTTKLSLLNALELGRADAA